MEIEDVTANASGVITTFNRSTLGARGIDMVSTSVVNDGTYVSYPIYDAHGNNVGAVSKNGSGFNLSDEKSYDAWGALRSGNTSGGKATYCANLGHKQDDESGLIYMRARYYEPGMGRFVSEDPAYDGQNWYAFCGNEPVNAADRSGRSEWEITQILTKAWEVFTESPRVWGHFPRSGDLILKRLIEQLMDFSKQAQRDGQRLITEGEADQQVAACMGSEAEMQAQIGMIKQDLGCRRIGEGVAAQLGVGVIKCMLELMKGNGIEPWDFFR